MSARSLSSMPSNDEDKPFYAMGVNMAREMGQVVSNLLSKEEMDVMLQGFTAKMQGKIDEDEMATMLNEHGPKLNELINARVGDKLTLEKQSGEDFAEKYLADNSSAEKTDSGLVYHETQAGTGEQATLECTVLVHYHGMLVNGKVFDSSVERGEPVKFPLRGVIPGWQEGVAKMNVGGKATLVVPSSLAYGEQGSPPVIPPGATLQFDVELLEVEGPAAATSQ